MVDSTRPAPARSTRRTFVLASLSAVLAVPMFSALSEAQAPLDAAGVASVVQSFYDGTTTIEARFRQNQFTKLYNRNEQARGTVVFQKPGRMRWDYAQPNGQVFVSDGRRLSIYQPPEEGETHGQLIVRPVSEEQLPQAFSFLLGTGRLDRDFHLRLLDAARQGFPDGYVLELRPKVASPHYEKVLFFVQVVTRGQRQAGVIKRVLIIDAAGNRNRFDFDNLRFDGNVPASRFRFRAPRNTRTVQP